MALPYEVIIEYNNDSCVETRELGLGSLHDFMVDNAEVKPYLRPMSSMTEEEINEAIQISRTKYYNNIGEWYRFVSINEEFLDWLLKNHLDFMGLIPKDLAIEVTESNNPYKE